VTALDLSVVIPVFNEEANVEPLCVELTGALAELGIGYEIIFVEDGSSDRTLERLRSIADRDSRVQVLCFARNYGQTAAIQAGFGRAVGGTVVTMDGDLQNDPADIGRLLDRMGEGYDIVAGWRQERKDYFVTRRIPSVAANWLIRRLVGGGIHDNGCGIKAYRREVVERTHLYSDMHRFLVPMLSLTGGRVTELVVNHRPRRAGKTKYGLSRIWKFALDVVNLKMILRFSSHPAAWFAVLGAPLVVLGLLAAAVSLYIWVTKDGEYPVVAVATALIAFFATVQLVLFGMIAELVVRLGDFKETEPLLLNIENRGIGGHEGV
jgi:glycosyltransferase involved in cell wall biosynthesis